MSDAPKQKTNFQVIIVSPDNIIFEGEANRLFAPGTQQEIAILPNHTPLYAQLSKGQIRVISPQGETKTFDIDSGIIRVKKNRITIITGF